MPLVRVDLPRGKSEDYLKTLGDVVYDAMVATLNVPQNDRFQIFHEHGADSLIIDRTYLDVARSPECIVIQITLNEGRSTEMKRAFYKTLADGLHERLSMRREDVIIGLIEVKKENWSFGNGVAQYAPE